MTIDTSHADGQETGGSIDRRRFIELTGAGATTATLAGCLPEEETESTDTPGQTTDDEQGTPEGPPEGNIRIGHMAPTSGSAAFLGTGSSRSAQLAVDQINEDGGIMDREVELVEADTAGSPSTAQGEVERLVNQADVDVIVGTYISEVTQSILDYTADFDIPFIVTGSAAPSTVTDFIGQDYERYKNFCRLGPINSDLQAQSFSTYADYLSDTYGWNTFAFVADRAAWTTPYEDILPGDLRDKGYEVGYEDQISIETENFSPVLDDVADSGANALFRFFAHNNAIPMMNEWHERELPFAIEGIHVTSQFPRYFQLSQGAGLYESTSQSAAGGVTPVTERTIPFIEAYQQRYEGEGPPVRHPMYMGFHTYDGIYFYREVVESAGTWDYENYLDDIVDGYLSTEMVGTAGESRLWGPDGDYPHDIIPERDDDGDIVSQTVTQWQQDGALECVWPEVHASADHLRPAWMQ